MKTTNSLYILAMVGLACSFGKPPTVYAMEPAREFLNELRAAHLFDLAVEYLDGVKDSPLVPTEFKETLAYERGVTMVKWATLQKDYGIREKQLDEAQDVLRKFIRSQPKNPLVSAANNELGNLLVQRAGIKVELAKKSDDRVTRDKLFQESKGMYDEAIKVLIIVLADLKGKLEEFPKGRNPNLAAKQIALRDELRAAYLQCQLLKAAAREEMAETEPKGSKPHTELLLAAAKEYGAIYEKYRTRLAGLYARLYQGRCYAKMNDHKEALAILADLLDQPDQPQEFRDLKVKTLLLACESWFAFMPTRHEAAIKRLTPFLDTARPDEVKTEPFLTLQLWLAKVYKARGEDLMLREPEKKTEIVQSLSKAKSLASFVSFRPSMVQLEAQQIFPGRTFSITDFPELQREPRTFCRIQSCRKAGFFGDAGRRAAGQGAFQAVIRAGCQRNRKVTPYQDLPTPRQVCKTDGK